MKKIFISCTLAIATMPTWPQTGKDEITPENVLIRPEAPLSAKDTSLRKAISDWSNQQLKSTDYKKIKAHPSASVFPGAMKTGYQFVNQPVHIRHKKIPDTLVAIVSRLNYSNPWGANLYSTGLYAAPGEYIEVITKRKGVSVQIGSQSDHLDQWVAGKEDWRRMPIIVKNQVLEKESTKLASPFGGLIYISAPVDAADWEDDITIKHAVAAPLFILGKTTVEEWKVQLKNNKSPWGELSANNVILTVPDSILQKVDDPVSTMKLWDLVLGGEMELAQIPQPFYRQQRLVIDEHIGGGFMHSGYPIMVHHSPSRRLLSADVIANPQLLMLPSKGGANWGFFHEIGHNLQNLDWVFGGTTEVSCNFFSLYMFDRLLGGRDEAHSAISNSNTQKQMKKYFAEGAGYEKWKSDPFLGLIMFRQLQEAFGWEAYKAFFREYQRIAAQKYKETKAAEAEGEAKEGNGNRKRRRGSDMNDQEKRDLWVKTFSTIVQRDISGFFETWGIPISDATQKELGNLQPWKPYNFPPVN